MLKLEARLRKAHDRRRVHHGRHTPPSVAEVTAGLPVAALNGSSSEAVAVLDPPQDEPADDSIDDTASLIVRDKTHVATPMTATDALHEMELVGHDFFLYMDADTSLPSVVYRRHGYDYGVLRLSTG